MRQALVLYKKEEAGLLSQDDDGSFSFQYLDHWLSNPAKPAISLNLPKRTEAYRSDYLFPFFFHLLPEGTNRKLLCNWLKIDMDDDFGLLLIVARHDTIGAITIKPINESHRAFPD
jgi:HipA-like protein